MSDKKQSSIFKSFTRIEPVKVSLPYDDEIYLALLNEFRIIHLLYHRNKNQHRVARWWSYLDILRRHLRKILLIIEDINEIITFRRLSTIRFNKRKKSFVKVNEFPLMTEKKITKKVIQNKKKVKVEKLIKFHNKLTDAQAVSLIDKKLSLLLKESKYLYKKSIPSAYWLFMGVVELSQFTNIGFVLIGFIAKVSNVLSKIEGIDVNLKFQKTVEKTNKEIQTKQPKEEIPIVEDDLGEAIDLQDVETVEQLIEEKEETKEEIVEPPAKKSKPNNIMDDLFGATPAKKDKNKKDKTKEGKDKKKKKKASSAMDHIFGF